MAARFSPWFVAVALLSSVVLAAPSLAGVRIGDPRNPRDPQPAEPRGGEGTFEIGIGPLLSEPGENIGGAITIAFPHTKHSSLVVRGQFVRSDAHSDDFGILRVRADLSNVQIGGRMIVPSGDARFFVDASVGGGVIASTIDWDLGFGAIHHEETTWVGVASVSAGLMLMLPGLPFGAFAEAGATPLFNSNGFSYTYPARFGLAIRTD